MFLSKVWNMRVYTGKRGKVYCILNFAIKIGRRDSKAIGRIVNETKWLRILNKYGIGPRVYFCGESFLVMKRLKGEKILDYFKHASKSEKIIVIKDILEQCRTLDKLKVDKFEMHRPIKHILIGKKVVMIDFERCRYSNKPKNVTGFVQFTSRFDFKIDKKLLIDYKKEYGDKNFKRILNSITG